ncbi:phage tail assembly chaperone [Lacticaseibacillus saniviri]|uniref:Phage XkdN-like protein n=1 Tax=Lacticaseibacillus saniviri JCM 17471 = DSM 24301 TaxID=1293598 RepID=A0A0R2MSR8_9LACO|nr:hypothetical protein [Lacticaseibacillus saniviri]KRO16628.1 hypothetical protein IV56_GL001073 [Lacticaseibacillus saniviri JCM 17471 = DSM 24301]
MAQQSIENFLAQNVEPVETNKEVHFKRFKDPFIIRALTSKEMDNVRKAATRKVRNRAGVMTAETDQDKFSDGLIVAALVSPDPNNAQLQESWDTVADPAGTIKNMLLAGEYVELGQQVQTLSGFDADEFDNVRDEVKN